MEKLWSGRFQKELAPDAFDFNASIGVDARLYREDIAGSVAHARMLAGCGIISREDAGQIERGLLEILGEIERGELPIDPKSEDIHTFVEAALTKKIGDAGRRLHTARSRNDQVALDLRLYLKSELGEVTALLKGVISAITQKAGEHGDTVMPGYTHLQRAQPISFAHHILAYAFMFLRDIGRLADCGKRLDASPLGAGALSGTTHPIDRDATAAALGFSRAGENSIDCVSDRDFVCEAIFCISAVMMHLSRFCEEIILWSSWEFKFIEIDDAYATGSSIMPQKKNPDIAELIRGKTGRVYGDLISILTVLKGLPLAYNKDMQEDKEALFDAIDTVRGSLSLFREMFSSITVLKDNMRAAAGKGFLAATDCADYLAKKGMPFRDAYKMAGEIVLYAIQNGKTLESLGLSEYRRFSPLFESDIYSAVDLLECVKRRVSKGSTSPEWVAWQIGQIEEELGRV